MNIQSVCNSFLDRILKPQERKKNWFLVITTATRNPTTAIKKKRGTFSATQEGKLIADREKVPKFKNVLYFSVLRFQRIIKAHRSFLQHRYHLLHE